MKGSALIASFIVIVIGSMLVGGLLLNISKESRMAKMLNDSVKALYIAEAGLERAISDLILDGDWFDGDINDYPAEGVNIVDFVPIDYNPDGIGNTQNFANGEYLVEIKKVNNNKVILKSTGTLLGQTRIITEEVLKSSGIFDWAIFSNEEIKFENNPNKVDSYNSELGEYGGWNVYENGNVGTNAIGNSPPAVKLEDESIIKGSVTIGPEGNVETDIVTEGTADITGGSDAAEGLTELNSVEPPDAVKDSVSKGDLDIEDATTTIDTNGKYDSIRVEGNSVLTIDAGGGDRIIYVTGQLKIADTSKLQIINGGKVDIYIGASFIMEGNTGINDNSKNPSWLTLYGTNTLMDAKLEGDSELYGAIYMPDLPMNVEFKLENGGTIYGALVANKVKLEDGGVVHYDEALAGTGPGSTSIKTDDWQEAYKGDI